MLNAQDIRTLFADAYYEAARAGAYMRTATEMLEGLRNLFENNTEPYKIWRQIDRALGQSLEDAAILGAIQKLKKGFITAVYDQEKKAILAAFNENEAKGWQRWIQTFAQGLKEWKDEIFNALPFEHFPFAKERQPTLDLIKKTLPYVMQERWAESHPLFMFLAQESLLSNDVRADFWATAGQIQLYYFLHNEKALQNFQEAQALAPNLSRVERSFGEYYLKDLTIEDAPQRIETARQHFQKALQLDPEQIENYLYLGDSYSEEDKIQVAAEWYRDAMRKNPGAPEPYARLISLCGKPNFLKEHEAEIADWVHKIAKLEPLREYSACIDAGYAFQKNERYEDAEKWFEKAIDLDATKLAGYLNRGYLYRDWDKMTAAEQAFTRVLELDPQNFDAHWELGWLYQNQDQWAKALDAFEKSLPLRPEWNQYVLDAIESMQEKLGHPEAAEANLLEALRLNPEDAKTTDSLHALVNRWKKSPGWQYALDLLQKMRDLKGDAYEAEFHNRLGIVYYENGKYDISIEHYKKALLIRPNDAIQNENIGLAFEAAGRLKEAEAAYNRAVMHAPNDSIPHNRLGIFYYNIQEYDKAISCYQTAITIDAGNAVYWNNLALAQEYGGKFIAEAEQSYQKAIELAPDTASYYNDLGVYYHNRGNYEAAITQYQKAIALAPNIGLYLSNIGFAHETIGNQEAALAAYLKAVQYDAAQGGRIAKLYFIKGEYELSERYARIALEAFPANGLAYDFLAQALQQQGRMAEAEAVLQKAIENCASDQDIFYNNLGLHYYNLQLYEKAITFYQKAIDLRSNFALYYDNIGLAFENLSLWQEAEAVYKKSVELAPDNALYLNRLGTFYFRQNQFAAAKNYYEKTVNIAEQDPVSWENLGLTYEQLDQAEAAEAAFRKALEVAQQNRDLYFNRMGVFLYRQGREVEAQPFYQQAIQLSAKPVYFENQGLAYEKQLQWNEAQQAYEQALELAQTVEKDLYLNRLGVFYFNQQQYDKAINYYQQAIAAVPKPVYYENIGLAYNTMGQVQEAIEAYKQSASLDSSNATVFNILGNLLYRNGNAAEAIPFYQKAAALSPNVAFNHENLGLAYEQNGQFQEAEAAYQKALEVAFDTDKALYYNRLGIFYYNQFQNEQAIEHYQQALKWNDSNPVFYENLGLAYEQSNQLPEAEQAYLQALDRAAEKEGYYNRLGNLYLKMHDSARAQESFEEAISANPDRALYYDNLAFIFEQQQQWDKAIVAYKRASALEPDNALYYDRIANVLVASEKVTEALSWFEQAIVRNPANTLTMNSLLQAIATLPDPSPGKKILQNLLSIAGVDKALVQQTLSVLSDTKPNDTSKS